MRKIRFTVRDAEILYSIPKPPSDLATIVRHFMFTNRAAPPTYEEITSCLTNALRIGIIREEGECLVVEDSWYDRIHAADATSDNEIDSMLDFEDWFVNVEFDDAHDIVFSITIEEFQRILSRL